MIGVESNQASLDSIGTEATSSKSSEPGSIMGGEGAGLMIGVEPNQAPLDSIGPKATSSKKPLIMGFIQTKTLVTGKMNPDFLNSPDDMDSNPLDLPAAPSDLRRSARNANAKNKAILTLPTLQKRSSRKRKSAQKKAEILQASVLLTRKKKPH